MDRIAALAFALLYIEESGVPLGIPGDFFIGYVGHAIPRTPAALLIAWLGFIILVVAGASNLYLVSRRWGHRLLQGRPARALHLTPARMERAEGWYRRWGILTVIFGRHVPGLRIPLTVAAGMSRMSYPAFAASVAVSTALWSGILLLIGAGFAAWVPALASIPVRNNGVAGVVAALALVLALMIVGRRIFGIQAPSRNLSSARYKSHDNVSPDPVSRGGSTCDIDAAMQRMKVVGIGTVLGVGTAALAKTGLYSLLSNRFEMDPERVQVIIALAITVLLTGSVAALWRSARLGVLAGVAAIITGVLLPVAIMSASEPPPLGLHWRLDLNRLLLNEAVLAAASGCLVTVAASLGALARRSVRRPSLRHAVVALGVVVTGAAVAQPATALAMFGPTYQAHHVEMPVAAPQTGAAGSTGGEAPAPSCPPGPSTLSEVKVPSAALGATRTVLVQLPSGYPKCAPIGGYPVIYLLHGDPGNMRDWPNMGSQELFDAAQASGVGAYVVVYPDGGGTWTDWSDSADGSWKMGTFISSDLVHYIDRHYATKPDARQRFIGGFSSGGFGAASLAFVHPNVFSGFLAYSGYYRTGLWMSQSRPLLPTDSPEWLATQPAAASVRVIIGTGLNDGPFTEEAVRYHERLKADAVGVEYLDEPGGHGSHLWRDLLWRSLPVVHKWIEQPIPVAHKQ
jgi:membrane protein DedA with SNARE-associated domain/enterochelin esterase-like enzyme